MGLAASMARFALLQQRQQLKQEQTKLEPKLKMPEEFETISSTAKKYEEIMDNAPNTSIRDISNDTILANLGVGINKPKKSDTDEKLRNETILKNEAQSKLDSLEEKIKEAEECSTTRSQKQIEKDIKNIEAKIKKNTKYKKEKVSCNICSYSEITNSKGKVIEYGVTLSDKSTRTFKSKKEYEAFIKNPYTYKNTLVETPQLKKLNEQKQKLEAELSSAQNRDKLPEYQKEAEELKNKIAKHDENIKELEARKEEEKAKANEKKDTSNNYYYDDEEAAAKAKYDKLQEQIQNRDNKLEMELNNLETQRLAVQREMLAFRRAFSS